MMRSTIVLLTLLSSAAAMNTRAQGVWYYSYPWLPNPYLQQGGSFAHPAVPYRMGALGAYPPAYFSYPMGRGSLPMRLNRPLHLCQIITGIERKGYDPIVEVEHEDDVWEVEAYKYGQLYELEVDPFTGRILAAELDEDESDEENKEGAE